MLLLTTEARSYWLSRRLTRRLSLVRRSLTRRSRRSSEASKPRTERECSLKISRISSSRGLWPTASLSLPRPTLYTDTAASSSERQIRLMILSSVLSRTGIRMSWRRIPTRMPPSHPHSVILSQERYQRILPRECSSLRRSPRLMRRAPSTSTTQIISSSLYSTAALSTLGICLTTAQS